jgi:hypothetical protein
MFHSSDISQDDVKGALHDLIFTIFIFFSSLFPLALPTIIQLSLTRTRTEPPHANTYYETASEPDNMSDSGKQEEKPMGEHEQDLDREHDNEHEQEHEHEAGTEMSAAEEVC